MDNQEIEASRSEGLVRTIIALAVLLIFWGGIAYAFWPQLLSSGWTLTNRARSIGATQIESKYFDVRNNSGASQAQANLVIKTLESDYEAILEFLKMPAGPRIPVLITDGGGPAMADENSLVIYYDNGLLNVDTAPFFLVILLQGRALAPEAGFFWTTGFTIYVVEEIGRAEGLLRQPADAWVVLLQQKEALFSLGQLMESLEVNPDLELPILARLLVESGSFVRWLANTYGTNAVEDILNGQSLETVVGLSLAEAEKNWLASLAEQNLQPKPCRAVAYGSLMGVLCESLNEKNP